MLIQSTPDAYDKLRLLGGGASDDLLMPDKTGGCGAPPTRSRTRPQDRDLGAGIFHALMPNGKSISLMRVLFTDVCQYDCAYCVNSVWVPRRRYAFKVEELARLFMELYQRQTAAGLFLSSGIPNSPDKTMEKLLSVVDMLRNHYGFKGYIHLKVMPGASAQYVEAAYRLGSRLSVNMEAPTAEHLRRLSTRKDFDRHIMGAMQTIHKYVQEGDNGAAGQVTQLVIGPAGESDWDIYQRMLQLYTQVGLKRVYYSPFRPVPHTPLEEHPATPTIRAHRLYQVDWLHRIYGYSEDELRSAFDDGGHLPLSVDPKLMLAAEQESEVDINTADYRHLLRVPGIGPVSAKRIVAQRRDHAIDTWRDLQAMGVVVRRARAFVAMAGSRPERPKQLKLELFKEREPASNSSLAEASCAACATHACGGCPVANASSTLRTAAC